MPRMATNKTNGDKLALLSGCIDLVARNQDRNAFESLFDHYAPLIRAYSLAREPGADLVADELVQEVMTRVWLKASKYNSSLANLNTWIFTVARNCRIDYLRRNSRYATEIDFGKKDLSLTHEDPGFQGDDEIQILADAISHMGERLNAFVARERTFTRNASHEFRTPLTVINVAADMMLIENNLPTKSLESMLKIKRAVYDMESLTDVFLMLAREDAGSMTQCEVDVNQVVRDQIERSEFLKKNKDVEIKLNEKSQLRVHSSETLIAVLLGNLIRNAILYTEQGEVRIDIGEDQLTIIDSGPGIPKSSIDNIFEPFHRSSNENSSGYGIGLTIVKRLCDRFHWDIEVSCEGRQGASFILRFNPA